MKNFCFNECEILLPKGVDMEKWAVVACDQFTSEPEYWEKLKSFIGEEKSTLNLVYPEIYLNDNPEQRIEKINSSIKEYLDGGVFRTLPKGFILTVRKTKFCEKRVGLIGAIDLEAYDFKSGVKNLIRATEGTITSRIPPRLKIRKDAYMEFPHVMVLMDDERREIIEPIYENRDKLEKLYSFDLNMDGGSIEGYFVSDFDSVKEKMSKLIDGNRLVTKYGTDDKFLFAVGDGNHSLATAKTHWDNIKNSLSEKERESHPARFALVEIVNVYDEGIYFEPIHRYVKNIDKEKFLSGLSGVDGGNITTFDGKEVKLKNKASLPEGIKNIDAYINNYIEEFGGEVDYVHGDDNLKKLVLSDNNSVGILFEKLDKNNLFGYVIKSGSLPRKTFSMGEGIEKRYYLEGRKIR